MRIIKNAQFIKSEENTKDEKSVYDMYEEKYLNAINGHLHIYAYT